jgi:NAD(P)-dependent dehydrogenase (short-subunit alcohol dehydrogenase family)
MTTALTRAQYPGLAGRRILVTGATGAIGATVAGELAAQGVHVIATARDAGRLAQLSASLPGAGHDAIAADLRDEDLSALMTDATRGGRLDGLVHCAGTSSVLPARMLDRAHLMADLEVNYLAFVELIRQFSRKRCYNPGASVVAISSIAAAQPEKCQTSYAAAKSALDTAVRTLAIELAPAGIRLNSVLPGAVGTRAMSDAEARGVDMDALMDKQLLGVIQPDAVAQTVVYLLSDASSAMTGRQVFLDGGRL